MYFDAQPPIERPVLHLARPDRKIISRLSEVLDETENFNVGQLTELTFTVPLKFETLEENKVNLNAQKLLERMLIRLRSEGQERWYIISGRNIDIDSKRAMITAKSTAYTLSDIPIKAFSTVENDHPDGLDYSSWTLSEIVRETVDRDEDTVWRLGDVDVEFDLKRREFTHDGSLGELVVAVAEKFGAVPIYDDLNLRIHFKHPDKIGRNRGLKLTYQNYLLSMSKDSNSDSLATQLALYGSEGLTIREVNPTGSTYIEDFSYFLYPYQEDANGNVLKSSMFMSDSLAGAIVKYSKKIETLTPSFQTILAQLETFMKDVGNLETDQSIQDTLLVQKQEQIDIWLGTNNGVSNATYEAEKAVIVKEIQRIETLIQSKKSQITALAGEDYFDTGYVELGSAGGQLGLLKQQLLIRNNFTPEQIKERSYYVIRKEWSNDSIVDAKELLEEGRKAFKDYSKPSLNVNLSVVDFLSSLEVPLVHKQLYLGDTVRTQDAWENRILEGKILGFTRNYYEKSLTLQIANFTKEEDGADKFLKMIYQASFAATVVNDNKYKWDLSKENNGTLNAIINDNFDAVKKKVTGGAAGLTEFSARGLTSRDYSNNSKYLVIQNGVLALTKDNGVNWGVAITPDGIVAERVMGKLIAGVNVTIEDQDGIMRILGNKLSISNRNKQEVIKLGLISPAGQADRFGLIVDNRKNQVGIVEDEGFYISRYNGQTIEKLLWTDTDGNLNAQKITATDMKIVNGDMKSGVVKNTNGDSVVQFGTFGMKIDSGSLVINGGLSDQNIRSASAWSAKETPEGSQAKVDAAKTLLEGQINETNTAISEVSGALDTLESDIATTFKDGIINQAEALSIKSNIDILNTDKQELGLEFSKIYNNGLLDSSSKSSLNTSHENYKTAHTNLLNKIAAVTSDSIITAAEKNEVSTLFQIYRDKIADIKTKISDAWNIVAGQSATAYTDSVKASLTSSINTVSGNLSTFQTTVTTTFKDGVINESEALSIKSNLDMLESSKSSLTSQYNGVYANNLLVDPQKNALKTAYDNFIAAHNAVVVSINTSTSDKVITDAERTDVSSKFGTYRTRLSELSTKIDEAWTSVDNKYAENKANSAATGAYNNAVLAIVDKMNVEADLPTSISFGTYGMRATTSDPSVYAQFDYRGLYIKGGAIQIEAGSNGLRLNTGEGLVSESSLVKVSLNAADGIKVKRKSDSKDVFSVDTSGKVVLEDIIVKSGSIQWDQLTSKPPNAWSDLSGKPTYLGSDRISSPLIQGGTIEGALFRANDYTSTAGISGTMELNKNGLKYTASVSNNDGFFPYTKYETYYDMSKMEIKRTKDRSDNDFTAREQSYTMVESALLSMYRKNKDSNLFTSLLISVDATDGPNIYSTRDLEISANTLNIDAKIQCGVNDLYARTFYQNGIKVSTETDVENRIGNHYARGRETVTVTSANPTQYYDVSFGKTFPGSPTVVATPNTTVPGTTVGGVGVTSITSTGFRIWVNRTAPGDVAVNWIAYY